MQLYYEMIETDKPIRVDQSTSKDYNYDNNPTIQNPPNFFNKFFFFNRLCMFVQYVKQINRETMYRFNENFTPMLSTTRILQNFLRKKQEHEKFNISTEIFHMEQRTLITLFVLSIVAGLTSLVPIYFQTILVKAVIGNTGNYYSVAVIICVMFLRFNLLNYLLNLSSNIAINVKLYLQNTFMRVIFYVNEDKFPQLKHRLKYLDVELIGEALFYIPYFIISLIIVIGVIVFVFININEYGCVVLGVYIFFISIIGISGRMAYLGMKANSKRMAQRQSFQKKSMMSLIKTAFQRMSEYVYVMLVVQKTVEIRQNLKINLFYIFGQTMGECCVVVSNIILYALVDRGILANAQVYYSVLFLVMTFYPIRYSVYGFYTILKGYEAFSQIKFQIDTITNETVDDLHTFEGTEHEQHVFVENVGDCFEYEYHKIADQKQQTAESSEENLSGINLKTKSSMKLIQIDVDNGETLMVLTRINSHPTCKQFLQQLIAEKPPKKSLAMINESEFMLPESLKENILFYEPYYEHEFRRILEITQLSSLARQIEQSSAAVNEKYLRFSDWHQTRIEIARALYKNVDYLVLDRPSILEDVQLLRNIIQERKQKGKMTIISNNMHKYYFKLADKILVIGKDSHEIGSYHELTLERHSLFNTMFLKHHEKVDTVSRIPECEHDHLTGIMQLPRVIEKPLQLQKTAFFQFFSFVHSKAEFIIIGSLVLPPCFKYYLQYLIGLSLSSNIFRTYLIIGVIYIVFIFLRGFCLSYYTNMASLSLYRKICRKFKSLNAHQILEIYQKPTVDLDFHARIIDRNLVMDFEYGQSILIQILVSFVVYCTGQPLYIAVAIPIIFFTVFTNGNYAKHARKIYLLRLRQTKNIHNMVANCIERSRSFSRYQKINDINTIFHAQNKVELIYACNIEWLQTGLRTVAEFLVIVLFSIFLIIMIKTVQNQSLYTSLVSLGCSMFINLSYLNTFYLKAFRQLEISLVSLTLCLDVLKNQPNLTERQHNRISESERITRIQEVDSIVYRDISLRYFKNICSKLNMTINRGDRIVMSGNSNTFKEIVFYMLENCIFDSDEIKGDILINGEVLKQFAIDKLYFLHADPIIPFIGNIYESLRLDDRKLTKIQLETMLAEFFHIMEAEPVFNGNTMVQTLSIEQKQLFEVFRAVKIEHCKILVIVDGFDNIDIVSRRKLTKYLLKQTSINMLIETTNLAQIIKLYPRHLVFDALNITEEDRDPAEVELIRMESMMDKFSRTQSFAEIPVATSTKVIRKQESKRE